MRLKLLFIFTLLALSLYGYSQNIYANNAIINNNLEIDGYSIDKISNDESMPLNSTAVPTSRAVNLFVADALATSSGLSDTTTANGEVLITYDSPLAGSATYTSAGFDVSGVATINVASLAPVDGTLYIDMGTDSTNWDLVATYNAYADDTKTLFHTHAMITPKYKFLRVRYINGSSLQSYFRLQVMAHYSKPPIESSTGEQVIYQDQQSILVRQVSDFNHDINFNRVGNISTIHKFGSNAAVGNGAYEAVWSASTSYTFATTLETFRVKAGGDANDTAAGSGAQSITIEYLDGNWEMQTEVLVTAGASASSATSSIGRRVLRAYVTDVGTYGGANIGVITIENTVTGTTLATIAAGVGQTQLAVYTVPLGYTAYLINLNYSVGIGNTANVRMFQRQNSDDFTGAAYTGKRLFYASGDISGFVDVPFKAYRIFPAKTDIWAEAIRITGSGSAYVSVDFDLILIKNQ